MGVNNDPLGQTYKITSSEHRFRLKFVLFRKVGTDVCTDGRTTCVKIMITTRRDYRSAS